MNCERIQTLFTDFEAGTLPAAEAEAIREHLKTCPTCQREWADLQDTLLKLDRWPEETPSPRMRAQFYAMLDTHLRDDRASASPFGPSRGGLVGWLESFWPRHSLGRAGLGLALVALGVLVGVRYATREKPGQVASAAELAATQKEIAELRSRVDSVHEWVAYSLAQQQPAHTRLQQVVSALHDKDNDERSLAQLLSTLAFDPSTNVRLSALEALYAQAEKPGVKQGVLAALPRESSPLVQVAMIDFLTSLKDTDAVPTLQQIARLPSTDQVVRTAAERGLAQL